jgi:hypothetical protein
VPFWYSAIPLFIWDRDLGFRENTVNYWLVVWVSTTVENCAVCAG